MAEKTSAVNDDVWEMDGPQLKPEAQRAIIEICLNALARKAARERAEREERQLKMRNEDSIYLE